MNPLKNDVRIADATKNTSKLIIIMKGINFTPPFTLPFLITEIKELDIKDVTISIITENFLKSDGVTP